VTITSPIAIILLEDLHACELPRNRQASTPDRIRTCDLRFRKPSLYPLSYGGGKGCASLSADRQRRYQNRRRATKPLEADESAGELLNQAIGRRIEGTMFLSPIGKGWSVGNLSRTYSRHRDQAGLPRDLVLYLAQHECGTKICREKGIEYARQLLGHANISTTQRYMHLDERELAEAQDLVG